MNRLKELRVKNGKSVADIADYLGVTAMAVYYYESGDRAIKIDYLKMLSVLYNCTVDDLV